MIMKEMNSIIVCKLNEYEFIFTKHLEHDFDLWRVKSGECYLPFNGIARLSLRPKIGLECRAFQTIALRFPMEELYSVPKHLENCILSEPSNRDALFEFHILKSEVASYARGLKHGIKTELIKLICI